jgi:hypothetical protein
MVSDGDEIAFTIAAIIDQRRSAIGGPVIFHAASDLS